MQQQQILSDTGEVKAANDDEVTKMSTAIKTNWANSTLEHLINAIKTETLETGEVKAEDDNEMTKIQYANEKNPATAADNGTQANESVLNGDCCHWNACKWKALSTVLWIYRTRLNGSKHKWRWYMQSCNCHGRANDRHQAGPFDQNSEKRLAEWSDWQKWLAGQHNHEMSSMSRSTWLRSRSWCRCRAMS